MTAREWVNQNSAIVTIGAVLLLLVSLGFIIMRVSGGSQYKARIVDVYYFDIDSGQLFTAKSNEIPPIDSPSGANKGVRAYVFACGDCADESQRFTGWLEMYTPDAKNVMINPPTSPESMDTFELMEKGHLVSADGRAWVQANTDKGFQVMEGIQTRCGETPAVPCYPGK